MPRQKKINPAVLYFPERIQTALGYLKDFPLTVAHAPGGFGKTTALNRFFVHAVPKSTPVYVHTFLTGQAQVSWNAVCKLIAQVDAHCAEELLAIGVPDQDSMPAIAETLETLECAEEAYLVLDSFEASGLPQPERLLEALSRHGGECLHVVALTRRLAAGALLANHRIYLLEADTFAFRAEDTEAYFKKAGLSVSRSRVLAVHQATDGWVMALHMQIMAYIKYGDFSGAGVDQLMQQVLWDSLSEAERGFFLSVSIFPRFTLTQACELSQMDAPHAEKLLRSQPAFVHFDHETYAFYLHTVFAAFLKERFQALSEARKKEIYSRGGEAARRAGDRKNAFRFYYDSGEWEHMFSAPLTSYELADVVDEDTKPMILDVMDHAPYALKAKYPAAMVPFAFTLFFLHENARLLCAQVEIEQIIRESSLPERRKNELLGEMDLLLSFLDYNRIDAMSEKHRRALERLQGPATLINIKSTWTFGSPSVLYLFWRESGKLAEELAQMDACMPVYYRLTQGHGIGAEHIMRAEACFLRGDDTGAEALCHRALFAADTRRQNSIYLCGLFLLARIAILRGDESLLQNATQGIVERARQNTEDLCRCTQDLSMGFLSALIGNHAVVAPWLSEGEITERRLVVMTQPFAYIIYGRCLADGREYRKLLGMCEHMAALSAIFPNLLPQVYCNIYKARALHASGRTAEAIAALTEALNLALPDGVYMPFAENYEGIRPLLPSVMVGAAASEGLAKIEALSGRLSKSFTALHAGKPELSPREREIYDLAKQGVDNKEIAARLGVQISTVKNQFSRIYEKAGVSGKAQLLLLDL